MSAVDTGGAGIRRADPGGMIANGFGAREPQTILVITYGGVGDVLLTTPLFESLKRAYPAARLDVFLQEGRAGILEGNPHVDRILVAEGRRRGWRSYYRFVSQFGGQYDLAVSARTTDRQTLFARVSGRRAVGLVPEPSVANLWKRLLLSAWVSRSQDHIAHDISRLAAVIGIEATTRTTKPYDPASPQRLDRLLPFDWRSEPFAVLHLIPRFRYKRWRLEGWVRVARSLIRRGLRVVLVGAADEDERAYADRLQRAVRCVDNVVGKTSLADGACLLSSASVYVGLDTSMTHLAAAIGVPTIALYGPRRTRHYFPYHEGLRLDRVESLSDGLERSANVWVLRGTCACIASNRLCEAVPNKSSECMEGIRPEEVMRVAGWVLDEIPCASGIASASGR